MKTNRRDTDRLGFELLERRTLLTAIDFNDAQGHDVPIPPDHYDGVTFMNAVWIDGPFGLGGLGAAIGFIPGEPFFPGNTHPIEVHFNTPVTDVSVDTWAAGENGARIRAFDGTTLVDSQQFVGRGFGGGRRDLNVSAPRITHVHLMQVNEYPGQGSGVDGVRFDNLKFTETKPDIVKGALTIDNNNNVTFSYTVTGTQLSKDTEAALYWASGPTENDILGDAARPVTIHMSTLLDKTITETVLESDLLPPPPSTTHLIVLLDAPAPGLINELFEDNNLLVEALLDIVKGALTVDSDDVTFSYTVTGTQLSKDTEAALYWASGPTENDILNEARNPLKIPMTTPLDMTITETVSWATLTKRPPGTSYLLVWLNPAGLIQEDNSNNLLSQPINPDIAVTAVNIDRGNVELAWGVTGGELMNGTTTVELFWSDNSTFEEGIDRVNQAYVHSNIEDYAASVPISALRGNQSSYLLFVVDPFDAVKDEPTFNNVRSIPWPPDCYRGQKIESVKLPGRPLGSLLKPGFPKIEFTISVAETTADFIVTSDYDPLSPDCEAVAGIEQFVVAEVAVGGLGVPLVPVPFPIPLALITGAETVTRQSGDATWDVGLLSIITVLSLVGGKLSFSLPVPFTTTLGTVVEPLFDLGLPNDATMEDVVHSAVVEPHRELLKDSLLLSLVDIVFFMDVSTTGFLVSDENGRQTGKSQGGTVVNEIPFSSYIESDNGALVYIASPDDGAYEAQLRHRPGDSEFHTVYIRDAEIASEHSFSSTTGNGVPEAYLSVLDSNGLTTSVSRILGDVDEDGTVGITDFLILSANFGNTGAQRVDGDLDRNGTVQFSDFLILSANFGSTRPQADPAITAEDSQLLVENASATDDFFNQLGPTLTLDDLL